MKLLTFIALSLLYSTANAECARTATGRVVCGNGEQAGSYNPNTGTARRSETNANGVTTTESSRGGEAKTKNGMGVYKSPTGTTCVKGRRGQGCN